jgi:hypothetical protein
VNDLHLYTVPFHLLAIVALFAGLDANGCRRVIRNGFFRRPLYAPRSPFWILRMIILSGRLRAGRGGSYKGAQLFKWVQENAGWARIAAAWLTAVIIGFVIYFFPLARLLNSLGQ